MLNLDCLKIFLTVAEYGSFSEAGRQLHISQPGISQTIQSLERELGVPLFVRQGTVQLTEAGQVLLPMAQELLSSVQRVKQTMYSLQDDIIGDITIGCSTASGKYLLPGIIAAFRRKFPRVRVNVMVSSRESVIKKLLNGEVFMAVSSKQEGHSDLEYQEFFTDVVILVVPSNHRWAKYGKIYPDDLLDEPVILREAAAGTMEVLINGLRQHDITTEMLNVSMELGNAEAIEIAVEEGLGVAFVSRLAAARGLALGRVVEVSVKGMELTRAIHLVRNHRQVATRAQVEFFNFVREFLNEEKRKILV